MIVIGITGRARHGKNTVAAAIQEACVDRFDCKQYEISDYVLESAKRLGKIPPNLTRNELTPQHLAALVEHGLFMRKRYPGVWMQRAASDIEHDRPQIAILPNIRFLNEESFVRGYGDPGVIIRVKTVLSEGVDFISCDRDPNSPMETEQGLISPDYFITVKRGQADLTEAMARTIFEHIIKGIR